MQNNPQNTLRPPYLKINSKVMKIHSNTLIDTTIQFHTNHKEILTSIPTYIKKTIRLHKHINNKISYKNINKNNEKQKTNKNNTSQKD